MYSIICDVKEIVIKSKNKIIAKITYLVSMIKNSGHLFCRQIELRDNPFIFKDIIYFVEFAKRGMCFLLLGHIFGCRPSSRIVCFDLHGNALPAVIGGTGANDRALVLDDFDWVQLLPHILFSNKINSLFAC